MMALCVIFILFSISAAFSQTAPEAPACYSRFDYESKMLERIVLVEHRMNMLVENTKRDLEQFQSALRRMKKDQNTRFHEMRKEFEAFEDKQRFAQSLKLNELTTIGDELKNVSNNMLLDHELKQKELEFMFTNMSEHLKQDISDKHAEVVSDLKTLTDNLETEHKDKLREMTTVEKELQEMSDSLKEEQSVKLMAVEAIGDEIKLEVQERMVKLEAAERSQQLEYDNVYQKFEETVNQTWNEIRVSGLNMKPTVAFNIRDVTNKRPSNDEIVRFSYSLVNTDSVYDSSTGLFTAPVNGTYWFSVQMCGFNSNYRMSFRIVVNERVVSDSSTLAVDYSCTTSNAVATMKQGDTACVKAANTQQRYGYYDMIRSSTYTRSAFIGSLVH